MWSSRKTPIGNIPGISAGASNRHEDKGGGPIIDYVGSCPRNRDTSIEVAIRLRLQIR
jgi:hypothetical protein